MIVSKRNVGVLCLGLLSACGGGTFARSPTAQSGAVEVPLSTLAEDPSYNGQWVQTEGVYMQPSPIGNCPVNTLAMVFLDPRMINVGGPSMSDVDGLLLVCTDEEQFAWLVQFPLSVVRFDLVGQIAYNGDDMTNVGFPAVMQTPTIDLLAPVGVPIPFF